MDRFLIALILAALLLLLPAKAFGGAVQPAFFSLIFPQLLPEFRTEDRNMPARRKRRKDGRCLEGFADYEKDKGSAAGLLAGLLMLFSLSPGAMAAVYWGQRGEEVRQVQQKLKQWGYYSGSVDGVFGQSTYNAIIRFQKKNGLTADGVAGQATLAAMGISQTRAAAASASASSSYASDIELLAKLIHGEARGEPYVGMVAVGAVVLNRVRSSRFPNTLAGVVYQSGAFDAVSDGQINLTPSEQSRRAARDAMNGWDPTGGCLYYYNPSTATSSWIWSREVRLTIGEHSFAV